MDETLEDLVLLHELLVTVAASDPFFEVRPGREVIEDAGGDPIEREDRRGRAHVDDGDAP